MSDTITTEDIQRLFDTVHENSKSSNAMVINRTTWNNLCNDYTMLMNENGKLRSKVAALSTCNKKLKEMQTIPAGSQAQNRAIL